MRKIFADLKIEGEEINEMSVMFIPLHFFNLKCAIWFIFSNGKDKTSTEGFALRVFSDFVGENL